jgi:hypothetical protein
MRGISISPKDHFTISKTPGGRSRGLKDIGKAVEEALGSLISNIKEAVGNLSGQNR